jgi:hypothetical protein
MPFGFAHFNKPTPAGVTRAATISSVVLGVFLLWLNSGDNLFSEHTTHALSSLCGLAIALINALKPFFGVDINQPFVPTSQVTGIENK